MADNHFKISKGVTYAPQASAPSNPVDGDIYYDSTLNKFQAYQNGAWADAVGGGSGQGGINYVTNPGAETDIVGWQDYNDGAGSEPIDGIGIGGASSEETDTVMTNNAQAPTTNASQWYGQSFTTTSAGDLSKIVISIYTGGGSPTGTAAMDVWTVDGSNKPLVKIGTSNAVSLASFPTVFDTFLTFTFAVPVAVSATTEYACLLNTDNINYNGAQVRFSHDSAGGYSGGNFLKSSDAGVNWTVTADDMDAQFTVDVGGAPASIVLSRDTNTSNILIGDASFKSTKDALDRQGQGHSTDITIDPRYKGSKINISFDYKNDSVYESGFYKIFIYDIDNTVLLGSVLSDNDGDILYHDGDGTTFQGLFYATDSLNYRIIIHNTSTNASAWNVFFDSVKASPDEFAPGAIITEWVDFSSVWSTTSNVTSVSGKWRRVGDTMHMQAGIQYSGTTNSGTLTVQIPGGNLLDAAKVASHSAIENLNLWQWFDNSGGLGESGVVETGSTSTIKFRKPSDGGLLDGTDFNNGDRVVVNAFLPISGWKASNLVSTQEFRVSTIFSAFSGNPASAATTNPIIFPTERVNTFNAYDSTTGKFEALRTGRVSVNGYLGSVVSSGYSLYLYKNNVLQFLIGQNSGTNGPTGFSGSIDVVKGDTVSVRPNATVDSGNASVTFEMSPDFSVYGAMATGSPTITRLTSGSGTYTTPNGVTYLRITAVGAGGGGGGSGTGGGTAAGVGGNTTFGTSLLTANGGAIGVWGGTSSNGGVGGATTVSSPAVTLKKLTGGKGGNATPYNTSMQYTTAERGGSSILGVNTSQANSGAGGGGGGSGATAVVRGTGGGGGGGIEAHIANPDATYAYAVGAGGTAGGAGTSGAVGVAGGSGVIIIEEYY